MATGELAVSSLAALRPQLWKYLALKEMFCCFAAKSP